MATFKDDRRAPRKKFTTSIKGEVTLTGGGMVHVTVDRDSEEYPPSGTEVTITWEREPTREEAVRQVIHDALLNGQMLGIRAEISTPAYRHGFEDIDPFSEIAKRVLAALEGTQ